MNCGVVATCLTCLARELLSPAAASVLTMHLLSSSTSDPIDSVQRTIAAAGFHHSPNFSPRGFFERSRECIR
jgi:hypothetical protein